MSIERLGEQFAPLQSSAQEFSQVCDCLDRNSSAPLRLNGEVDFRLDDAERLSLADVIEEVGEKVVKSAVNNRHPMAMAHMHPPPATVSVVGDLIIGALNQCAFVWEEAPAAAAVEREVVRWLCRRFGFDDRATGLLTSGGTMSNLLAVHLALARAKEKGSPVEELCMIASDQAHFSIAKAAALLGLPPHALIRLETDACGRLPVGAVKDAARALARAGRAPFLFISTAGTTNAGVLEPVDEFVETAARTDAWCHVDAAHGGMLTLSPRHRYSSEAWRKADSIAFDPHKAMYVSYAVGVLLLRDRHLDAPLEFLSEYALKGQCDDDAGWRHFEGSRRFEALKLWMAIKHFGLLGYAQLTDHAMALGRSFSAKIESSADFSLLTEPDTNIVCFRYRGDLRDASAENEVNAEAQRSLFRSGAGPLLSTTTLKNVVYLRAVLTNPMLDESHLDRVLVRVREQCLRYASKLVARGAPA